MKPEERTHTASKPNSMSELQRQASVDALRQGVDELMKVSSHTKSIKLALRLLKEV
jgi:hypothetical protein